MVRIASLVPSGTDIVRALGLEEALVGVTYACDAPGRPVLVRPRRSKAGMTQAEIDAASGAEAAARQSPYIVDEARLAELAPDVVLTQDTCPVCALPGDEGRRAAGSCPSVLSLNPHTLEETLEAVLAVAAACGLPDRGRGLVAHLRRRIAAVAERCAAERPVRVVCLEWMDPPWNAGHWVPDLVALAGGRDLLASPGRYSERMTWERVRSAGAEVTFLMPCSLDQERTLADARGLDLAGLGEVWAAAGGKLFSKAAPGLVDGLETLAAVLHPEGAAPPRHPAVCVGGSRQARLSPAPSLPVP
jgi:iron complex transport system substrate-binding protein